jgi:hypothetical protein
MLCLGHITNAYVGRQLKVIQSLQWMSPARYLLSRKDTSNRPFKPRLIIFNLYELIPKENRGLCDKLH